ncbi:MAG: condensation domain-containing protein, partial [Micromonosporaceae bacterium]
MKSDAAPWELMAGQQGMWDSQQIAPESTAFNVSQYVEIEGDLDVDLLVTALRLALEEAEAYRLRFQIVDGRPRQHLGELDDATIRVIDLGGEPDPRRAAEDWMRRDTGTPVDPLHDPMYVQVVFVLGHRRFFWYQRFHHLAVDGHSGSLFSAAVARHYNALLAGQEPDRTTLEPYAVLRDADRAYRGSADRDRDRDFWLGALAGLPAPTRQLPQQLRRRPDALARHSRTLGAGETQAVRDAAARLGTSVAGLVIAAAATYEHRSTGARDILIGIPVLGRKSMRELRGIGTTTNVMPLRLEVTPRTTARELVDQAARAIRTGLRHQRYRFEDIFSDLSLAGGMPTGMRVNVMTPDYSVPFGDCTATIHSLPGGVIEDRGINVYDRQGAATIDVDVDVNHDLHPPSLGEEISRRLLRLLAGFGEAAADDPVSRFSLLDDTERRQVLTGWNQTTEPVPAATVPELFAAQVARTPGATAVCGDGLTLRYAELDTRANQLAHHLRGAGLGTESVIAIALERGADLVVASLAVLKAGAAFVHVDPAGATGAAVSGTDAVMLLTSTRVRDALRAAPVQVLALDDLALDALLATGPDTAPELAAHPDALAYLVYPPGGSEPVAVTHRGAVNLVTAQRRDLALDGAARVLHGAPTGSAAAVAELLAALCSG